MVTGVKLRLLERNKVYRDKEQLLLVSQKTQSEHALCLSVLDYKLLFAISRFRVEIYHFRIHVSQRFCCLFLLLK